VGWSSGMVGTDGTLSLRLYVIASKRSICHQLFMHGKCQDPGEEVCRHRIAPKCGSVRIGDYTTGTREWLPIHIRENPRFENRNLRRPGGSASIFGRLLDVIDDKNLNWRFGRFEFQSKLFLERGENRETRWIGYVARPRGVLRHVSSPPQM
jgi:ribosomal protein L32